MRRVFKIIIQYIASFFFYMVGKLPNKRFIYFESMHGQQYSDNPRAIFEEISKRPEFSNYKLVWGVKEGFEEPFQHHNVFYVKRFGWKWFLIMPRAAVWIINTRFPLWLTKPKHTIYVQTWHGTPIKTIGIDVPKTVNINDTYVRNFIKETERWDLLIAPNLYSKKIFAKAFKFNGKFIDSGYPRNDLLINYSNNLEIVEKIKSRIGISKLDKRKIVLYAPTWRDNQIKLENSYSFVSDINLDAWDRELGQDCILLVRGHYLTVFNEKSNENIVNVSNYEDMNQLLLVADILISDFSSVIFDFSLLKRPIVLYANDFEQYNSQIRGLYPMKISIIHNSMLSVQSKLFELVRNYINGRACYNYKIFEKESLWEKGSASAMVASTIKDLLG